MVEHAAGNDQVVGLITVLQPFYEIAEQKSGPLQAGDFLADQTSQESVFVCLDRFDIGARRLEHVGMTTIERPQFKHLAIRQISELFDRPGDPRILKSG